MNYKNTNYMFERAYEAVTATNKGMQYSPNNVRRIIFSPDGVVVFKYGGGVVTKSFDSNAKAAMHKELAVGGTYKPMSRALGVEQSARETKVCSHVEEIIYCMESSMGDRSTRLLMPKELNFSNTLLGKRQEISGADLLSGLRGRFVRLKHIFVFNGTLKSILPYAEELKRNKEYFLGDALRDKGHLYVIQGENWYKGHNFRPKEYDIADADGSKNWKYIMGLKEEIEAKEKLRAVEFTDIKGKVAGSEKTDKKIKELALITAAVLKLKVLLSDKTKYRHLLSDNPGLKLEGYPEIVKHYLGIVTGLGLGIELYYDDNLLKENGLLVKNLGLLSVSFSDDRVDSDSLEKIVDTLKLKFYTWLLDFTLELGGYLQSKFRTMWDNVRRGKGEGLLVLEERREKLLGLNLKDLRVPGAWEKSILLNAMILCDLVMDFRDNNEYFTEEKWRKLLKKVV